MGEFRGPSLDGMDEMIIKNKSSDNNRFDLEARGNLGNDRNLSISLFFYCEITKKQRFDIIIN